MYPSGYMYSMLGIPGVEKRLCVTLRYIVAVKFVYVQERFACNDAFNFVQVLAAGDSDTWLLL